MYGPFFAGYFAMSKLTATKKQTPLNLLKACVLIAFGLFLFLLIPRPAMASSCDILMRTLIPIENSDDPKVLQSQLLKLIEKLSRLTQITGPYNVKKISTNPLSNIEKEIVPDQQIYEIRNASGLVKLSDREIVVFFYNQVQNKIYEMENKIFQAYAVSLLRNGKFQKELLNDELVSSLARTVKALNSYPETEPHLLSVDQAKKVLESSYNTPTPEQIRGFVKAWDKTEDKQFDILIKSGFDPFEADSIVKIIKSDEINNGCCRGGCLFCPKSVGLRKLNRERSSPP